MRRELLQLHNEHLRLGPNDIDATVDLCSDINLSHWVATHRRFEDGDESNHEYIEALSDQNFATAHQIQFIWQLGLWRIHALLEAIVGQWFPELESESWAQKLRGLAARGIVVSPRLRAALSDWTRLRNLLSHRPPDAPTLYHQLERRDLEEFAAIARQVLLEIEEQLGRGCPSGVSSNPHPG